MNEFLDKLPQAYTPDIYRVKCEAVYQHVYDYNAWAGQTG